MIVCGLAPAEWVYAAVGGATSSYTRGIGLMKGTQLVAACAFDWWNGANVYMHTRIVGRTTKTYWWAIFDYAFNKLNCARATALVEAGNEACVKLITHLGFEQEATMSGAGRKGQNMLVYRLNREDCKQLEWKP